ncbi:Mannitol 1-phosphate dehydrogenase [Pyrenophora teres f. maculata]|nr:Mannitol 1-phosphate dehydrogenase [Pyrenophora teres f. maculata]
MAASPTKPYSLAIIGGGISGLSLAIALLQYNIPFTLYESAPRFGEIGAGVSFGPNAGLAMRLVSPAIFNAFEKCKTENPGSKLDVWFTIRVGDARKADKDGFVKPGKKVGDELFDVRMPPGGDRGNVHRATFLNELVKHVPDSNVKFRKRFKDMHEADDGSGDMVVEFEDGSTAQHSAVIGCDGIKSMTRKWLLGKDHPAANAVFSGKYSYRGLMSMDDAVELLGDEAARNSQMYLGYHGHLLTFPIEHGKIMNVVAFSCRETWDHENWVISTSKQSMEAEFDGWGPHVQKVVKAMQKPDIWALFMHPPCETYTKGRVCLVGDAAHASTPHQGAGAGMCMEDIYIMSNLIKEADSVDDLKKAFMAFDQVRRKRTQENVQRSYENGKMYDFEQYGDDLDRIEKAYSEKMKWVWDIDLEAQLAQAKKIMREQ